MGQYAGSDIVLESNSLLRAVFFIPKNKERQVTVMRQAVTTMQYVFAGIGGFMGWFLGGLDGFLYALLMFVVIDYATGLMAAFVQKKVSSEVGFKGICKKVAIFCLVGIGHVLDTQVMPSFSNRTSTPMDLRWRTVSKRSTVFLANRLIDLVSMMSIFPASQSVSILLNSSLL